MPVEMMEFNELSWEMQADKKSEPIVFVNIETTGPWLEPSLRSPKSASAANFAEVIPECFEDLTAFAGKASAVEASVDTACDEDQGWVVGRSVRASHAENEDLQVDSILNEQCARQEGWDAGLEQSRADLAEAITVERERFASLAQSLLRAFGAAQEDHLHRLEQEAVRLALKCAARILHREVRTDTLALTGAVRAALGQLAASTEVRLVVPLQDEALWRESMALIPGMAYRPLVVGDDAMKSGDCRIESDLGIADLSIASQLAVMEETMLYAQKEEPDPGEANGHWNAGSRPQANSSGEEGVPEFASLHELRVEGGAGNES